jgi:hypothetical protein
MELMTRQCIIPSLISCMTCISHGLSRPTAPHHQDMEVVNESVIDLGEIVAQYFALELDPYPRSPQAIGASADDGVQISNAIESADGSTFATPGTLESEPEDEGPENWQEIMNSFKPAATADDDPDEEAWFRTSDLKPPSGSGTRGK